MSEPRDSFSQLLATYADATSGETLDAATLRRRVLEEGRAERRRASRKLAWVLPIAATFVASAALAASQPAVRQALREGLHALFASTPSTKPSAPGTRRPSSPSPLPSAPVP